MRTLAILPIKNLAVAKQRLAGTLPGGTRKALAQAMFSDVLAALHKVRSIDEVAVVTGDAVAQSAARGKRRVVLADREQDGQSEAAELGISHAIAEGYERVLLVPGDTPLLDPAEVESLLDDAPRRGVAIVPDRHGEGTNALVITPPGAFEPSFGPGSRARHQTNAAAAGIEHAVIEVASLALDVDTPDDLQQLSQALEHRHGSAALTRGALRQLGRTRPRTAVGARFAA